MLADQYSISRDIQKWALVIADLDKAKSIMQRARDEVPEKISPMKFDVVVRLIAELRDEAELKRKKASDEVTKFYEEHQEQIEEAIKELTSDTQRLKARIDLRDWE